MRDHMEHTELPLFSRQPQTANVFSGGMIVCFTNYSREEIGGKRETFPRTAEWIYGSILAPEFNSPRSYPPSIFRVNGSNGFHIRWSLRSRNSQFINLIGQCVAIDFAAPATAKGRRVLYHSNEYTFLFCFLVFTSRAHAYSLSSCSLNEKTERAGERIKMSTALWGKRRRKNSLRDEFVRTAILAAF